MKQGFRLGIFLSILLTLPAAAQIRLTGATIFDSQSNGAFRGLHGWNTIDDFYWNAYAFTGSVQSPTFLNSGETDTSLNPSYTFQPGTNILYIAGASDPVATLGVNLYFNGIVDKARISAVVPNNGSTNFSIITPGVQTMGLRSKYESSLGLGAFTNGLWNIRLIGFHTVRPPVDVVTAENATPDSGLDTIARLTFLVEQHQKLLIEVSEIRICWASETNTLYQLQYKSEATTNLWVNAGDLVVGHAGSTCTNQAVSSPQRFYRVKTISP